MNAVKLYLILSAVVLLIADRFSGLFRQSNAWWLVPLLYIGIFIAFILLQLLVFVFTILFTSMKKPAKAEDFFRFIVRHTLPILVFLARVKIEAEGCDKIPEDKNMLFVCNHQHDFDPVIIFAAFPMKKISFIGKKDILVEMPFVAKAMHLLSCLFIDRENDREAAKTIVSAIKDLKEGDRSIGLFPEGYTSKTGDLQPLRNGSLKIALKSKAKIAVCVVDNMREIPKNICRRKTVVKFRLVDVITPELYENMTTAELGNLIHSEMETALADMRK